MKLFTPYEELSEKDRNEILLDLVEFGEVDTRAKWFVAPGTIRRIKFEHEREFTELTRVKKRVHHREQSTPRLDRKDRELREKVQAVKLGNVSWNSKRVADHMGLELSVVNKLWR